MVLAVLIFPACGGVYAQTSDTLLVMSYNLLNYPGSNSATRNPEFRKTLRYVDPDILVVQEMTSAAGVSEFLSQVLNFGQPGTYSAAPFINGPDTDNAMFYKAAKVNFISQTVLETQLRDINGYRLRPVGVGADTVDLQIYSAHLKASQGFESERFGEADTLRNHLNALAPGYFVACGDFNLYTSSEPAYVELTGSQADNSGRLYDPINTPGNWHSSASFASVHSQSTRLNNLGDGGSTGGLDDRFDFALLSYEFQSGNGWVYVSGSYRTVGQDGNHFNLDVNDGPNLSVPDTIPDALHLCSDHLPVYFKCVRQSQAIASIALLQPNGSELLYTGEPYTILWASQNLSGTVSLRINRTYPSGNFVDIVSGTTDDGAFTWTINDPTTVTARIQVVSDAQPAVNDVSDANFFIQHPALNLVSPDGGETFFIGSGLSMLWAGSGFSGNVRIELNRDYPLGGWSILYGSAVNDGAETWSVSGPTTTHARLRIYSINQPAVGDTSLADFTIANPYVQMDAPNGGESWPVGSTRDITWSFGGVSGNARIELNRSFPSATWSTLAAAVAVEDQLIPWTVTSPLTTTARIRVTLLSDTTKRDTSNANFEIRAAATPPSVVHDPHADALPGPVVFTALLSDDLPGVSGTLFYRQEPAVVFDSLPLIATGNPDEFAATPTLAPGTFDYRIRAYDTESLTAETDTFVFQVEPSCGTTLAYDDGTAELFNWSQQDSFAWAVRFTPPGSPFIICATELFIAASHPDSVHSQIRVQLLDADGPGGQPGTVLYESLKGSLGNLVGGPSAADWVRSVLFSDEGAPLAFNGDFYVAVSNPPGGNEAFGLDQTLVEAGRSYVYDPCDHTWLSEAAGDSNARLGNRMIRVQGWMMLPPTVVASRSGNDVRLNWNSTGSPYYRIYSALIPGGPYSTVEGATMDTVFFDLGAIGAGSSLFYQVVSSSAP